MRRRPLKAAMACAALALGIAAAPAAANPQQMSAAPDSTVVPMSQDGLRTFIIEKPQEEIRKELASDNMSRAPLVSPRAHDTMRATVGVGYVQGADWGTEFLASGAAGGLQVQFNSLLTTGAAGLVLDRGALSLFDPDRQWQFEAGDLFSNLRGASRGARFSMHVKGQRPTLSVYGPRPGLPDRTTILAYRDQIRFRSQTLLDAEVATNRSYVLRTRLGSRRFDAEATYRSIRKPISTEDFSISAGVVLWHGIGVTAGTTTSHEADRDSEWRNVSLRFPLSRSFTLTLERAFADAAGVTMSTTAAMVNGSAGGVHFFQRYQVGEFDYARLDSTFSLDRQQTQSMASYQRGSRVNMTLQLATQHTDAGQTEMWEELQTTLNLTRRTALQTVTAVPDLLNASRLRASLRQSIGGPFALQAEYGRLSTFQPVVGALDRSRFKLMMYMTRDVGTPARGADVQGRVLDHTGRVVAGVRVKLGQYTADTDRSGRYHFSKVPAGDYVISLDPQYVPADYAWDGREVRLTLRWSSHFVEDLLVAPLNAVHGRVYTDRNGNGRFDEGEGVANVPVYLSDRTTATDPNGAFSFYNVSPGSYVARIDGNTLPAGFQPGKVFALPITATDGRAVTGVEFQLVPRTKPIVWQDAAPQ